MTELSLARLCAFSYIKLPDALKIRLPMRISAAAKILRESGDTAHERLLRSLCDAMETALLTLVSAPENAKTGFAACVFRDKNAHIAIFRGSDSALDWADNFAAPFFGSRQYADVSALASQYTAGPLLFAGHSKGGHNALWALAGAPNALARAVAFNAQGFSKNQLSPAQSERLDVRGVNYVTKGDIVGRLLSHPERRVSVCSCAQMQGEYSLGHGLDEMCFDERGGLVYCNPLENSE